MFTAIGVSKIMLDGVKVIVQKRTANGRRYNDVQVQLHDFELNIIQLTWLSNCQQDEFDAIIAHLANPELKQKRLMTKAAKDLGVRRNTFYKLIKQRTTSNVQSGVPVMARRIRKRQT